MIRISQESTTIGKTLRELVLPKESKIVLVVREEGKTHVPTINTALKEGDRVIALTTPETEAELRSIIRGS